MKRSKRVDLDEALEQRLLLVGRSAACGTRRTRSSPAASRAGGARRCARSRRRSCRSTSRAGAAARRPAWRPARACAGSRAGIRAMSSGVRPSGSGSSAGSPSGSAPSGSSCAARWPCVRCAFSSDVAAWTACSSSSSTVRRAARPSARLARGRGRGGRRRRRGRRRRASTPSSCEELLVEAVLALQVLLDDREEAPGLRALDDPVVVGRGHRHDLLGADHRRRWRRARPGSRSSRWRRSCPGRP